MHLLCCCTISAGSQTSNFLYCLFRASFLWQLSSPHVHVKLCIDLVFIVAIQKCQWISRHIDKCVSEYNNLRLLPTIEVVYSSFFFVKHGFFQNADWLSNTEHCWFCFTSKLSLLSSVGILIFLQLHSCDSHWGRHFVYMIAFPPHKLWWWNSLFQQVSEGNNWLVFTRHHYIRLCRSWVAWSLSQSSWFRHNGSVRFDWWRNR